MQKAPRGAGLRATSICNWPVGSQCPGGRVSFLSSPQTLENASFSVSSISRYPYRYPQTLVGTLDSSPQPVQPPAKRLGMQGPGAGPVKAGSGAHARLHQAQTGRLRRHDPRRARLTIPWR